MNSFIFRFEKPCDHWLHFHSSFVKDKIICKSFGVERREASEIPKSKYMRRVILGVAAIWLNFFLFYFTLTFVEDTFNYCKSRLQYCFIPFDDFIMFHSFDNIILACSIHLTITKKCSILFRNIVCDFLKLIFGFN